MQLFSFWNPKTTSPGDQTEQQPEFGLAVEPHVPLEREKFKKSKNEWNFSTLMISRSFSFFVAQNVQKIYESLLLTLSRDISWSENWLGCWYAWIFFSLIEKKVKVNVSIFGHSFEILEKKWKRLKRIVFLKLLVFSLTFTSFFSYANNCKTIPKVR